MAYEQLKQEVIAYSKEIGIDKIGFASAEPFAELKARLKEQQELGYASGFEKGTIEERTEPKRLMPGAESLIAIALSYPTRMKNEPKSVKGDRRGMFARASWGTDYHIVLKEKLDKLAAFLQEKLAGFESRSMVDTGELSDRAVAERAGIGFSGKNTLMISPEYGSYIYLGEMITNVPFTPDDTITDGCGTCTKCIDACPTGALVEPGRLNSQACMAFQSLTKGFMPDEHRNKLGNLIYGYETCQVVCPYNRDVDFHHHEEFEPDPELVKPRLLDLLSISNREFKEKFGKMAGSWRGKKPLQRNAILSLAHYKEKAATDKLIELMQQDPRPVIRGTAAWAIGKIGEEKGFDAIEEAMKRESDHEVLVEMEKGLDFRIEHTN
ncbi:iron-sulfur cluster-binding protein [Gracilibacillus halophilus YIM-C55.5]|uniref:Iron-sulfur cluster-binding protein n=1 Tax=Gracilibacillus halophilus YIM-C55.5 TaxID=1308866 RepID=N4WBK6_9BACI|nr:tRNA epoxyqueuosine(34) reductase QueG [Gracilibacillus halophilus]ENH96624.1 iron-sulfur cluster-binding protein [Gracilibacillus halophilus YIM-C55.5]